jgi:hypothetical protein
MIEKIRWDIIILYIDVAFQDLTPSLLTSLHESCWKILQQLFYYKAHTNTKTSLGFLSHWACPRELIQFLCQVSDQ